MVQNPQHEETAPEAAGDAFGIWTESLLRISLAGFGGALAGLAISRGRAMSSAAGIRKPYVDPELPSTWALACTAFAGMVELFRVTSPTSALLALMMETDDTKGNETVSLWDMQRWGAVVGDYTLGGAVAGAAFQGARIQTRTGTRLVAAGRLPAPRVGIIAGLVPGAALGLVAGVVTVGLEYLEEQLTPEAELQETEEEEDPIRAEVEAMSTEEIQRQIDELRGNQKES